MVPRGRTGARMFAKRTSCDSSLCALGPCRTPGDLIVAAADEVPLGCPNRVLPLDLRRYAAERLRRGDAHVTPAAAAALAAISRGSHPGAVGELLGAGKLTLLVPRVAHAIRGAGTRQEPVKEAAPPAAIPGAVKAGVKFKVVEDATDRPIPGVVLRIRLPNADEQDYTTRTDGLVEIDEIDPGMCAVSCHCERARLERTYKFVAMGEEVVSPLPPAAHADGKELKTQTDVRILVVEEHKVQTGESLKGIAEANGMTWQELAEFNWGTSVPDEINEHLRDDVGCTAKTADGFNYSFRSEDEPGIVYVPKPWQQDGLATENTHAIRTRTLGGLRCWIRLDVDPMDVETFDDRFVLLGVDDAYRVEKTIKDDRVPGDHYVDLRYSGLRAGGRYSLQVFESEESQPRFVFENVPYEELAGLSPAAGEAGDDDESEPSPGEDDAYPEDSDVDEEELADAAGEGAAD